MRCGRSFIFQMKVVPFNLFPNTLACPAFDDFFYNPAPFELPILSRLQISGTAQVFNRVNTAAGGPTPFTTSYKKYPCLSDG